MRRKTLSGLTIAGIVAAHLLATTPGVRAEHQSPFHRSISARVDFGTVANLGRGNARPVVFLGDWSRASSGEEFPLTFNGEVIHDPTPRTNVPGVTVVRSEGALRVTFHCNQRPQDFEKAYIRVLLNGARFVGFQNDRAHEFEHGNNGKFGLIRRANSTFGHDDEIVFRPNSNQVQLFSGCSTDIDTVTLFYVPLSVTPPPPPRPLPQCGDGRDNDGDGRVDGQDPGCSNPSDNDESNEPAHFSIELSDSQDPIVCGGVLRYQITVQNLASFSSPVTITQVLPSGTEFIRAIGNGQLVGDRIVWRGVLRGDQIATLISEVQVVACNRTSIRSVASVGTDSDDETTQVITRPDPDPSEPACDDGRDNDNDGGTDYPFDLGCSEPLDTRE